MEVNYIKYLEGEVRAARGKKKSDRTRLRLKVGLAKSLEEFGYHALRLSDATEAAGVAESTIYFYFKDRTQAIREIMLEFLEDFMQTHIDLRVRQFPRARGETPFERLRQSILIWTELVRANPGMMRCVVQMGDDDLNFRPDVQRFNMRLVVRVSERVLRYRAREDKDIAVLYTFSVSAMLDDLIRRYYIHPDAELRSIVDRVGPAEEVIADVVATIWMKVLYPEALLPQGTDEVIGAILNWTTPSAITG